MNYRQPIAYRHAQDLMISFHEHGPCLYGLTTEDIQWLCFFGNSQQVWQRASTGHSWLFISQAVSENSAIINMVVFSDGLLLLPLDIDPVRRLLDQVLMSMVDNLFEGLSPCINLFLPTVFFSPFVKRCLEFRSVQSPCLASTRSWVWPPTQKWKTKQNNPVCLVFSISLLQCPFNLQTPLFS